MSLNEAGKLCGGQQVGCCQVVAAHNVDRDRPASRARNLLVWAEPAVVKVEFYHEDQTEIRLGQTRMIPEVTEEKTVAVDRGSIYGAVTCDREEDAIHMSQTEMNRMKEVVEAQVELAPSQQTWSAAAEPGSQIR